MAEGRFHLYFCKESDDEFEGFRRDEIQLNFDSDEEPHIDFASDHSDSESSDDDGKNSDPAFTNWTDMS